MVYTMYEVSQANSENNSCKSTVIPLKAWAAMVVVIATVRVTDLISNSSPTGVVVVLEIVLHAVSKTVVRV